MQTWELCSGRSFCKACALKLCAATMGVVCPAGHYEIVHNKATITADSTGKAAAGSSPVAGSQLAQDFLINPEILPVEPPARTPRTLVHIKKWSAHVCTATLQ